MTKLKSKKMTKSTFVIIIMAIAMVAMLAFGGTYAYFTATTSAVSKTTTTGTVQLGANTVSTLTAKVVPGQELLPGENDKVTVLPKSNVKTFVFVKFTIELTKATGQDINTTAASQIKSNETPDAEGEYKLVPTVETSTWKPVTGNDNVYYAVVADTAADTPITVCKSITFDGYSISTETLKGSLMGATITVAIDSSSIQYAGFENKTESGFESSTYDNLDAAAAAAYAKATIS